MLILGTFINNLVNNLIRNFDYSIRILISAILAVVALGSLYYAIKAQPKGKPGLKIGWTILCILSAIISVLYLVL